MNHPGPQDPEDFRNTTIGIEKNISAFQAVFVRTCICLRVIWLGSLGQKSLFIRGVCCMPGTGIVVSFDGTIF